LSKTYFAGRYDLHRDLDMKFVDHIRYVLATTLAEQQKQNGLGMREQAAWKLLKNAAVGILDGKYCR